MTRFFPIAGGGAFGALFLVGLLSVAATARDPGWYSDVQYLTWDVRADEAEAARASDSGGEVYLQPSEGERDCGWYESCSCEDTPQAPAPSPTAAPS